MFGRAFEVLFGLANLRLSYCSDFKFYEELKCKYVVF